MLRILIADGTPAAMQAERETFGIPSNASLFEAARRCRRDLLQSSAQPTGCSPSSSTLPVGAARSRRTFVSFVASWRAAGELRARATVFLHFRRNMNTDRDICTEERRSLREGVAALDAKR